MSEAEAQSGTPAGTGVPVIPAGPMPTNAVEARAARDVRMADRAFADKVFAGDPAAISEWRGLGAMIDASPEAAVSRAMSAEDPHGFIQDADVVELRGAAGHLRDRHLNETQVRETLGNKPHTQAEKDDAARLKRQYFASKEWTARLNAKEPDALNNWTVVNAILASPLKE
jgi:hypothetical protein